MLFKPIKNNNMRTFTTLKVVFLTAFLVITGMAVAQPLPYTTPFFFSEDFDYKPGGNLQVLSNKAWNLIGKTGENPIIVAGSLNHSILPNNLGNALELVTNNEKEANYQLFADDSQMRTGTLYFSLLLKVKKAVGHTAATDAEGNLSSLLTFYRTDNLEMGTKSGSNGHLFVKESAANKYKLGVIRYNLNKSNPNAFYAKNGENELELNYNQTYHVIVKLSYQEPDKTLRTETISLFIDPTSTLEPTPLAMHSGELTPDKGSAVHSFGFLQGSSSPNCIIDGIRIADTWAGLNLAIADNLQELNYFDFEVSAINRSIIINKAQNNMPVQIYSLLGELVGSGMTQNNQFQSTEMPQGIYLVKIGKKSVKIRL